MQVNSDTMRILYTVVHSLFQVIALNSLLVNIHITLITKPFL